MVVGQEGTVESVAGRFAPLHCHVLDELKVENFAVHVAAWIVANLFVHVPEVFGGLARGEFLSGGDQDYINVRKFLLKTPDNRAADYQGRVAWVVLKFFYKFVYGALVMLSQGFITSCN